MSARAATGPAVALALVAAYLAALGLLAASGLDRPWRFLGVPQESPPFLDLHNVLAAIECERQGLDPLASNPCDALGRPMNYPRVWLALGALGAGTGWTLPLGVAFGALALVAGLLALRPAGARQGLLAGALLCSPALMLLVERGNVEAVVLALLAAGAGLLGSSRPARQVLGLAAVAAAAVLKLYPAAGLAAAAIRGRPRWLSSAAAGLASALAVHFWATRADLAQIFRAIPRGKSVSYGADLVATEIARVAGTTAPRMLAPFLLAALAAAAWGARGTERRGAPPATGAAGAGFVLAAILYLATFAAGANWGYRLALLFLAVPQLLAWTRQGAWRRAARRVLGVLCFALFVVPLPLGRPVPRGLANAVWWLGQAATWSLAIGLSAILGALAWQAWRGLGPDGGASGPVSADRSRST